MNRAMLGYNPDFDLFDRLPAAPAARVDARSPVFDNIDAMSLAVDLLEVTEKPQLGPLVRRIVRRASEAIGRPLDSGVAHALANLLQVAARHALPSQPLATFTGDTDAKAKGRFFGIELEGLSPEDQEFETAKAFVRFAGEATRLASSAADALPSVNVAQVAALQSARRYAPGWLQLARPATASITGPHGSTTGAGYASILRGANHA